MPTPEVIANVRQLRAKLKETPPDTAEAANLARHIDTLLAEPTHAAHYEGLRARLVLASADLERRHPQLAASMNAVINALTTAGV
jgi:hypothetical protein